MKVFYLEERAAEQVQEGEEGKPIDSSAEGERGEGVTVFGNERTRL